MNHPKFTEPKELVVLLDVDGDPVDLCFPSDSPHSAWRWVTGGFTRVFDRIGEDPK